VSCNTRGLGYGRGTRKRVKNALKTSNSTQKIISGRGPIAPEI